MPEFNVIVEARVHIVDIDAAKACLDEFVNVAVEGETNVGTFTFRREQAEADNAHDALTYAVGVVHKRLTDNGIGPIGAMAADVEPWTQRPWWQT